MPSLWSGPDAPSPGVIFRAHDYLAMLLRSKQLSTNKRDLGGDGGGGDTGRASYRV